MITCSVGVCVYNEEKNIQKLLESLQRQKLRRVVIDEIIIVASGSTDKTTDIIKQCMKKDKRISLIKQKKREGKASAVNIFITAAHNDVLILIGGDLIPTDRLIDRLTTLFSDPEVGMAGGRPIPVNNIQDGFFGFAAHLLWDLHHRISLKHPKMGEVIAFRKIFKRIPLTTGADEANIEPLIRGQGYKIVYVPEAIVYNKAPANLRDFLLQRRRNYWLHMTVKYEQYYVVSTLDVWLIFKALSLFLQENPRFKYFMLTPGVMLLEAYARFLGWWDYRVTKRRHTIWETVPSTKTVSS